MDLILSKAYEFASSLSHKYVTIEHLALALVNYKNFKIMLEEFGTDQEGLATAIRTHVENMPIASTSPVEAQKTQGLDRVCNRAFTQVLFSGRQHLQTIDLFQSYHGRAT